MPTPQQPIVVQQPLSTSRNSKLDVYGLLRSQTWEYERLILSVLQVIRAEWIFDNPVYKQWANVSTTKLLWIKGKPGSGKSTLLKSLLKRLEQDDNDQIFLSFFFNARGAEIETSQIGLYRHLTLQLIDKVDAAAQKLLSLFGEKELAQGKVSWKANEPVTFLHDELALWRRQPVTVFIDALDECVEDEVRDIVQNFSRTCQLSASKHAQLRVCCTSRYYPHITVRDALGSSP